MMWPVKIESINGHVRASLLGDSQLHMDRPTREEAISALELEINRKVGLGELMVMNRPLQPLAAWWDPPPFDPVTAPDATEDGYAEQLREIVATRNAFDIDDAYANADYGETPEDFIRALYEIRDKQKEWDLKVLDQT